MPADTLATARGIRAPHGALSGLAWEPTGRRDTERHILMGRLLCGMTPRARMATLRYYLDFFTAHAIAEAPDAR